MSRTTDRAFPLRAVAALLLCSTVLGGCFTYQPIGQATPRRAESLHVTLDRPSDVRLTHNTANDVRDVYGELVHMDDSTLVLSAMRVVSASGYEQSGEDATVSLARANVAALQVKRLAPGRSLLFGAGLVALALTARFALSASGGKGSDTGTGGPTK